MTKNILLGLGAMSLAVLPIAAVVSCSATDGKGTLDGELKKFNKSFKSLNKTETAEIVAGKFIGDASAQLIVLETYIGKENVPSISEGFTFEVKKAIVNLEDNTKVDVQVTITETDSKEVVKSQDATLTIAGFKTIEVPKVPTLAEVAAQFRVELPTAVTPAGLVSAQVSRFLDDNYEGNKPPFVSNLGKELESSTLFKFEIASAKASSDSTKLEVMIKITEISSNTVETATLSFTGFTAPAK